VRDLGLGMIHRNAGSHDRDSGIGTTILRCLCLGFVAVSGPLAAEVYRCTTDGRVVYSDRPCSGPSTKIEIEQPLAPKSNEAQRLQNEANLGHVVVGMTAAQTEQAWGRPREISSENDKTGSIERWSYDRPSGTVILQFDGGKVSKISSVKSLSPAAAPAPAPTGQLTISEMEERERVDKGGERRFAHAGMTQAEVRGKLGPPSDRQVQNTRMGVADCWTYEPVRSDPQTLTTLCFSVDYLRVMYMERVVQR
jgi:Domain of unknown function (DUF4124)